MTPLAIALALVVAGCGGDDGERAYLDAVADSNRQMETDTFAALPQGEPPTRERVDGVIEARAAAVERLEELTPPASLRSEHEALVITLEVFVDESRRFMARTADLDTQAFGDALADSEDLELLAEAVGRVCRALQAKAAEAGHDVDLNC